MDICEVSVVIGFRNWGQDRLRLALDSLQAAFGTCNGEVILVDYGSTDPEPARAAAEITGSRLVRIDNVSVWSRSGALNAGFAQARGRLFISTDADMLFAPGTLETIHTWWQASGSSALYLQCRDLPPSLTVQSLSTGHVNWKELEAVSRLRPRWGVGGMMAIDRHSYGVLRGFDERMHTYGREDMDFAARARRAGLRMVWVEDQKARMYHMWHPSSADALQDSPAAIAALKQNRNIFDNDGTVARNRTIWNNSLPEAPPLISICLLSGYESLKDGRLADTIALQSIRDVEVLVSATGGQVQAASIESLVREVDCQVGDLDSMLEVASGKYTIALDSSYCLPETFLEELLVDAQGSVRAVVPRQLAFDPETNGFGFMPIGDENRTNTLLGVLAQTDILRSLAREQNISTINPGFLEILNSLGAEVLFSENTICLVEAKEAVRSSIDRYEIPSEIKRILWPLFSDSDTSRIANITGGPVETLADEKFDGSLEFTVVKRDGEITSKLGVLGNASLTDLARLRNLGCDFTVVLEPIVQADNSGRGIRWIISEAMFAIGQSDVIPHAVIVVEGDHDERGFATHDARPLSIKVERLGLDDHEKATLFFSKNELETSNILEFVDGRVRFILSQSDWEIGS